MRPRIDATRLTPFALISKTPDFAAVGVTPAEDALFTAVHYGLTMPPLDLPATAAREWYRDGITVTEAECRAALAACLAKSWLQVIDQSALANITDELRKRRFVGPIYGLPSIG